MAKHSITLDDNCELGLASEAQRRTALNPDNPQTADDVLTVELQALCRGYYADSVRAKAQAVTDAFLAAAPDKQATFEGQVIPIAVEVLGMEIPS